MDMDGVLWCWNGIVMIDTSISIGIMMAAMSDKMGQINYSRVVVVLDAILDQVVGTNVT